MTNKQIREAAASIVERLLIAEGYDVSAGRRGYDLTARRSEAELHIEVKGAGGTVAGVGGFRYLTSGEFDVARQDPHWEMWVVENLTKPEKAAVTTISRNDVLAMCKMEISWMLPMGAWCRESWRPVDTKVAQDAAAEAIR